MTKVKVTLIDIQTNFYLVQHTTTKDHDREQELYNDGTYRIFSYGCLEVSDNTLFLNGRDTEQDYVFIRAYSPHIKELVRIANTLEF